MALGGNFREALQKAFRGLETGLQGLQNGKLEAETPAEANARREWIREKLYIRRPDRVLLVYEGMQLGLTVEEINEITGIDPWFLLQIKHI